MNVLQQNIKLKANTFNYIEHINIHITYHQGDKKNRLNEYDSDNSRE